MMKCSSHIANNDDDDDAQHTTICLIHINYYTHVNSIDTKFKLKETHMGPSDFY